MLKVNGIDVIETMKVGDVINGEKVVYIRDMYYITEKGRAIDDEKLYKVYKAGHFWRNETPVVMSIYLQHCIDWVNDRRCFK